MKNFIVPVDFTESSIQTTLIAAQLAAQVQGGTLTLYNVYEAIAAGIDGTPLTDDTDARRKITELAFQNLKTRIQDLQPSVDVEYFEEEGTSLVSNLEKFAQQRSADFIVVGVSEGTGMEHFLLGTTAIDVAKRNICPVIIVPPNAIYKGVKRVLFASNYKEVTATTPIREIRSLLSLFGSEVHVVHIYQNPEEGSQAELKTATVQLREMLIEFSPQFHVLDETDFIGTIGRLVEEKDIDLILTVPHTHGFFSNLFSAGHTKKLVYESRVPVVAIHD